MNKKNNRFLFLLPRILGIIFIAFLLLFSLDVFSAGFTIWQIITGLFMHNLPALILLIILIIFWKKEIINGIIFILVGLFFIQSLIIVIPAFFIGFLFFINWFQKK